ncbi:hypothetical protein AYI70_g1825 [Smittium culicis]|uniref:Uncharacterized protein n=1 Tax=Smittium culicis TaxID=133412 RepID=A0A1R1YB09_9FUNG|nr:hypothetical protein AYI70_g1825 [Smittium culicis]
MKSIKNTFKQLEINYLKKKEASQHSDFSHETFKPENDENEITNKNAKCIRKVMRPSSETAHLDLLLMKKRYRVSSNDLNDVESKLLLLTEMDLDLSPSVETSIKNNAINYLSNEHFIPKKRRKYNQAEIEAERNEMHEKQKILKIMDKSNTNEFQPSFSRLGFSKEFYLKKEQILCKPLEFDPNSLINPDPQNVNGSKSLSQSSSIKKSTLKKMKKSFLLSSQGTVRKPTEPFRVLRFSKSEEQVPTYFTIAFYPPEPNSNNCKCVLRIGSKIDTASDGQMLDFFIYNEAISDIYAIDFKFLYSLENIKLIYDSNPKTTETESEETHPSKQPIADTEPVSDSTTLSNKTTKDSITSKSLDAPVEKIINIEVPENIPISKTTSNTKLQATPSNKKAKNQEPAPAIDSLDTKATDETNTLPPTSTNKPNSKRKASTKKNQKNIKASASKSNSATLNSDSTTSKTKEKSIKTSEVKNSSILEPDKNDSCLPIAESSPQFNTVDSSTSENLESNKTLKIDPKPTLYKDITETNSDSKMTKSSKNSNISSTKASNSTSGDKLSNENLDDTALDSSLKLPLTSTIPVEPSGSQKVNNSSEPFRTSEIVSPSNIQSSISIPSSANNISENSQQIGDISSTEAFIKRIIFQLQSRAKMAGRTNFNMEDIQSLNLSQAQLAYFMRSRQLNQTLSSQQAQLQANNQAQNPNDNTSLQTNDSTPSSAHAQVPGLPNGITKEMLSDPQIKLFIQNRINQQRQASLNKTPTNPANSINTNNTNIFNNQSSNLDSNVNPANINISMDMSNNPNRANINHPSQTQLQTPKGQNKALNEIAQTLQATPQTQSQIINRNQILGTNSSQPGQLGVVHPQMLSISQAQALNQSQSNINPQLAHQAQIQNQNSQQVKPQSAQNQGIFEYILNIPDIENISSQVSIQIFAAINNIQLDALTIEKKQQLVNLAKNGTLRNLIIKKKQQLVSQLLIKQRQNLQQQKTPQQIQAILLQQKLMEQQKAVLAHHSNNIPQSINATPSVTTGGNLNSLNTPSNSNAQPTYAQSNQSNNPIAMNSLPNQNEQNKFEQTPANSNSNGANSTNNINSNSQQMNNINGSVSKNGVSYNPVENSSNSQIQNFSEIEAGKSISQQISGSSHLSLENKSGAAYAHNASDTKNLSLLSAGNNLSKQMIAASPSHSIISNLSNSGNINKNPSSINPSLNSVIGKQTSISQSNAGGLSSTPLPNSLNFNSGSGQNILQGEALESALKNAEFTKNQNLLRIAHMAATNSLPPHISSQFTPEYIEKMVLSYKTYISKLQIQSGRAGGHFQSPPSNNENIIEKLNAATPKSSVKLNENIHLPGSSSNLISQMSPSGNISYILQPHFKFIDKLLLRDKNLHLAFFYFQLGQFLIYNIFSS